MENIPDNARPDMYKLVHKGLRSFMTEVLAGAGRADPSDGCEVTETLSQVRDLVVLCRDHLEHEDHFVHAAMEARRPGSSAATCRDHEHHVTALDALEARVRDVERAPQSPAAALDALYRELSLFVAENFEHMHLEETRNNALLWETHSDDELRAMEHAIVSSIPPETMTKYLRWMVPAMSAPERAGFLGGIRQGAPAEVFGHILGSLRPHLSERDWYKLATALDPLPMAA